MDKAVKIGAEWNSQAICDSCCMPITCGRNERGPTLDAGPQLWQLPTQHQPFGIELGDVCLSDKLPFDRPQLKETAGYLNRDNRMSAISNWR